MLFGKERRGKIFLPLYPEWKRRGRVEKIKNDFRALPLLGVPISLFTAVYQREWLYFSVRSDDLRAFGIPARNGAVAPAGPAGPVGPWMPAGP